MTEITIQKFMIITRNKNEGLRKEKEHFYLPVSKCRIGKIGQLCSCTGIEANILLFRKLIDMDDSFFPTHPMS